MITEDQLEQLAIQWFQDSGWTSDFQNLTFGPLPLSGELPATSL